MGKSNSDNGSEVIIGYSADSKGEHQEIDIDNELEDDAEEREERKKMRKGKRFFNTFGLAIKIFVYGTILGGWAQICFWFNRALETNEFEYWTSNIFTTFFIFIALLSYYRCSNADPYNPQKRIPNFMIDSKDIKACKNCKFWKPDRAHHCSSCGECVLEMDHHCPWVVNCVGSKNHKAFFLFCFYISICGLYFIYRSLYFFVYHISEKESLGIMFIFWWIYELIAIFPFSIMVSCLSCFHFGLSLNNMTTIDTMGGKSVRLPLFSDLFMQRESYYAFDKGFLANMCDFFGDSIFLWWFPTIKNYRSGQFYEKIPEVSEGEKLVFEKNSNGNQESSDILQIAKARDKELEQEAQKYLEQLEEYSKYKRFKFMDTEIEMPSEDNDEGISALS